MSFFSSTSILSSPCVFWENVLSTVLPIIAQFWAEEILSRASASYPGTPCPPGKILILCFLSLCIFLWQVSWFVGLEEFFSWDRRMLSCDEISLGNLSTNGKRANTWLTPSAPPQIHTHIYCICVKNVFLPEIGKEIFIRLIHVAHFRIERTHNH